MRFAIIGNSGSGKSTLAKRLASAVDAPVLDLDTVAWETGKIAEPRDPSLAHADVAAFCSTHQSWIVEGCYAGLIASTLERKPYLLFLEPGLEQCISNCKSRPWEPHKYKSQEEQDQKLHFLLAWVEDYYQRSGDMSLAEHQALFKAYDGKKAHLAKHSDIEEFLLFADAEKTSSRLFDADASRRST